MTRTRILDRTVAALAALGLAVAAGTSAAGAQVVVTVPPGQAAQALRADAAALASLRSLSHLAGLAAMADLSSLSSLASVSSLASASSLASLSHAAASNRLAVASTASHLAALAHLAAGAEGYTFRFSTTGEPTNQVSDSLYRQARERMNRGDYKRAAELFMDVARRAGKAALAGDALYWSAFSLYRDGSTSSLNDALSSLERLGRDFPGAANSGDASTLRVRVCGALAQRGDAKCAAEVTELSRGGTARSTSARPGETAGTTARGRGQQSTSDSGDEQGCPREDDDERIAALNALLQMDAERAIPILERVLARRDRCSTALRRKAVFLVSQKRDARSADILMAAVRSDPDGEVREQAVFWLGQTRDDRAVDMLQEILQKETNNEVLDKAVFALSQHRSERAATILRDLAQRDGASLKVREQAIFWLGQQRSEGNADLLKSLYGRVQEDVLKEKIIFSLSQHRGADNSKWLLDIAMNDRESMKMRKQALFWAGQHRTVSMDDLGGLYTRISDREMKEQIIFVYSQRRDPVAIDKLIDIARNEKDRELRKKAIFWLSQSRDPRALKLLEEIIG